METFERIKQIIHEQAGIPEQIITRDSNAMQLNVDSLDMAEIIMAVEEEFDVLLEDEKSILTVNDMVVCVETQLT